MAKGKVRAVYMRGGTSRALMFRLDDLPPADAADGYAAWTPIFIGAIGSPDPYGRQLNGIGGGITSLSKVAVIGPPTRPDADVDYTFGQVAVTDPAVSYRGNCGNISSAVGPFAVDQGLVAASGDRARVRIHNTNTAKIIVAEFPLLDGAWAEEGDFAMDGVAGTGAPIKLSFLDPGGATTGKTLPTGLASEPLAVDGVGMLTVSLVDAANPVCFAAAADLGLTGRETQAQISENAAVMKAAHEIRVAAAVRMGLSPDAGHARTVLTNLPLVGLLSRPDDARADEADASLIVRMFSADQAHKASPITGALCLAAAVGIEGSVAHGLARRTGDAIVIRHPTGAVHVDVDVDEGPDGPVVRSVSTYRTARRVMEGFVYY